MTATTTILPPLLRSETLRRSRREIISQRTKAALAEAKRRGIRLRNPRIEEARERAAAVRRTPVESNVLPLMRDLQTQGKGLREIARHFNRLDIRTSRGNLWYASTVSKASAM